MPSSSSSLSQPSSPVSIIDKVESFKADGNTQFQKGEINDAIHSYTSGLNSIDKALRMIKVRGGGGGGIVGGGGESEESSSPSSPSLSVEEESVTASIYFLKATLLSNRAMCHLKLGEVEKKKGNKADSSSSSSSSSYSPPPSSKVASTSALGTVVNVDQLDKCVKDCTAAFKSLDIVGGSVGVGGGEGESERTLSSKNTTTIREKILYRRARAYFLKDELNESAKDLLDLLSLDSSNKTASTLLRAVRTRHEMKRADNSPLAQALNDLRDSCHSCFGDGAVEKDVGGRNNNNNNQNKNNDDATDRNERVLRDIKIIFSLLSQDPTSTSMELGRRGGVPLLFQIASSSGVSIGSNNNKHRTLALNALSCACAHKPFVRIFVRPPYLSQMDLAMLVEDSCGGVGGGGGTDGGGTASGAADDDDVAVAAIALLLRIVVTLEEDSEEEQQQQQDPNDNDDQNETSKQSSLNKSNDDVRAIIAVDDVAVCRACIAALRCNTNSISPQRAALDLLTTWTSSSSSDRDYVSSAAADALSDSKQFVKKKKKKATRLELNRMSPREFAAHKKREYEEVQRNKKRAKEVSILFCSRSSNDDRNDKTGGGGGIKGSGLDALLRCASSLHADARHQRAVVVTLGRLLSNVKDGDDENENQAEDENENKKKKSGASGDKNGSDAGIGGAVKKLVGAYLGANEKEKKKKNITTSHDCGVIIEEINEEDEEEDDDEDDDEDEDYEEEKVEEEEDDEEDEGKRADADLDIHPSLKKIEERIRRGLLVSSLFVTGEELGCWGLGEAWAHGHGIRELQYLIDCSDVAAAAAAAEEGVVDRPRQKQKGKKQKRQELRQKRAMFVASEIIAAASSTEKGRSILTPLVQSGRLEILLESDDDDVSSGAASALAKLGLASKVLSKNEGEMMGMLQLAVDLLYDDHNDVDDKSIHHRIGSSDNKSKDDEVEKTSTSIERGIEVLSYLASRTNVKEEIAHGFKSSSSAAHGGRQQQQQQQQRRRGGGGGKSALERLVELSNLPGAASCAYGLGIASIFALLAVSVDTLRKEAFAGKDITPEQYDELQNLGKTDEEKELSKRESENESDNSSSVSARIRKMAAANVPRAMAKLMMDDGGGHHDGGVSEGTQEQLVLGMSRMANEPSVRGIMIQQGCLSACIKVEKTEIETESETKKHVIQNARHCIAKLLITTNPSILTSAQRMGSIKALIDLVKEHESTDLMRFEALLSLTNLASVDDESKNRIVAERGLNVLGYAMFSEHDMVRRAATEAMSNLFPNEEFLKYLREDEHLRLWIAFAYDYEENFICSRAAAGCLAMSSQDHGVALTLSKATHFCDMIKSLLECGNLELMHRVLVILSNMLEHGGKITDSVISTGAIAFCERYVDSFNANEEENDGLGFTKEERESMAVTLDMAKNIISNFR